MGIAKTLTHGHTMNATSVVLASLLAGATPILEAQTLYKPIHEVNDSMVRVSAEAIAYARAAARNATGNSELQRLAYGFKDTLVAPILTNELARMRLECTGTGSSAVPKGKPVGEYCDAALVVSAEETAKATINKTASVTEPTHLLSIYYAAELAAGNLSQDDSEEIKKSAAFNRAKRIADSGFVNMQAVPAQMCTGPKKESCSPVSIAYRPRTGEHVLTPGNALDAGFVTNTYSLFTTGNNVGIAGAIAFKEKYDAISTACRERMVTATPDECEVNGAALSGRTVPTIVKALTSQR